MTFFQFGLVAFALATIALLFIIDKTATFGRNLLLVFIMLVYVVAFGSMLGSFSYFMWTSLP